MKIILFIFLALFWGGSFIAIKFMVVVAPPLWSAAVRIAAALFILAVVYKLTKKEFTVPKSVRALTWWAGLFSQGIPFSFLFWGEKNISPGLAGILNGTAPMWTFVFGICFLGKSEPFTGKKLIGLLFGVLGLGLIFGPKLVDSLTGSSTLGAVAVGIMALLYGAGNILNRALFLKAEKPHIHGALFQETFASLIYIIVVAFVIEGMPHFSNWITQPSVAISALYLGWVSTALAFFIYYYLIKEWGAFRASTIAYLLPITTTFLDYLFNKNIPSKYDVLGCAVILGGILLIQEKAASKVETKAA